MTVQPQNATLVRSDSGAVLVEYALVIALLSIGMLGGMRAIEYATLTAYNYVTSELMNYAERNGS
jgi:Flp pilus assembly pilin Flp